jgi:hypothetical protein
LSRDLWLSSKQRRRICLRNRLRPLLLMLLKLQRLLKVLLKR